MIPLSNWLSAGGRTAAPLGLADVSDPLACSADDEQTRAAEIEDAFQRGRLEGSEATADEWERKLAALQVIHDAERDALRAEADVRLSAVIAAGIAEAVSDLRMNIETAVSTVLKPFLTEQATRAAATELLRLIDEELRQQSSPHLEIKAPAALHEALHGLLAERSIACVLTEADEIRLISTQGSLRYESLAERWIAVLEGNAP